MFDQNGEGMYYGGQSRAMGSDPRNNASRLGSNAGLGLQGAMGDYATAQGAQAGALGMYRDAAMGLGPSVAQSQLEAAGDQNQARAMAMAAQSRGGGLGGGQRAAVAAGMGAQAQTQQQMAQLRAMEQQAAMQGYAGLAAGMGDQSLQQQQMMMAQQQGILGMQFGDDAARRDAAQRSREYRTQRNLGWSQYGTGVAGSMLGGIFGGGG